ncbi:MAG: hypothetical protein WC527_00015 [Candidatus Margulisiibacteriota bacterium]
MTISKMSVVMAFAKGMFPMEEYGYLPFFHHPSARIVAESPQRTMELRLRASQPRELDNRRYYPGWDCVESTHYLLEACKDLSMEAKPVMVSTEAHVRDWALVAGEEICSLTPGVIESINAGTGKLISSSNEQQIADEFEEVWKSRGIIDDRLTNTMELLNWMTVGQFNFSNYAGIYFPQRGVFEFVFQTNCIVNGRKIDGLEFSLLTPLRKLEKIREKMAEGKIRRAIRVMSPQVKRAPFSQHTPLGEEYETAKQICVTGAKEIAPLWFGLLDPDWTKQFAPKKSFFGRFFT